MVTVEKPSITSSRALALASTVVVVAALYLAREVLIPLALSILLSFLLAPLVRRLEPLIGRSAAVVSVVLAFLATFGVLVWVMSGQLVDLAKKLPEYQENIHHKIEAIHGGMGSAIRRATDTIMQLRREITPSTPQASGSPIPVQQVEPSPSLFQYIRDALGSLIQPMTTIGIAIIFLFFMLMKRGDLRDRVIRLVGQGKLNITTTALDDVATRISRYLLMELLVNTLYGIMVFAGLYALGIPNPALWGALAGVLRFVPYLGVWIAAALPFALSIAMPGWWRTICTFGLYAFLEMFTPYAIEPWLYGSSTGISSLAVLMAAVFWTWLWGGIGLLLSVPLTVCLVVLGKYVPQFDFFTILLGDEPALPGAVRFYHRLLAADLHEALVVVKQSLAQKPLIDVYDEIIVPTLAMVNSDFHERRVDVARSTLVFNGVRQVLHEIRSKSKPQERIYKARVLCVAPNDQPDTIAAQMLAHELQSQGYNASVAELGDLAVNSVAGPKIVFIPSLPPFELRHAHRLSRRVAQVVHNEFILYVGILGSHQTRFDESAFPQRIVTTLRAAFEGIAATARDLERQPAEAVAALPGARAPARASARVQRADSEKGPAEPGTAAAPSERVTP